MSVELKAGTRQHILRRAEFLEKMSSDKIVTDPSAAGMLKAGSQSLKQLAARIPINEGAGAITEEMTAEILRRFEAINAPVLQVLDRIHPPEGPATPLDGTERGETGPAAGGTGAEPGALPGNEPAASAAEEPAMAGIDVRIKEAATALLKHAREKNELLKSREKYQAYVERLAEKDIANLFMNEGRWDVEKIHEGVRPIFEQDNLILQALKGLRDAEVRLLELFATYQQKLKSAPATAQLSGKIFQLTAGKPAPGAEMKDMSIMYLIHLLANIERKEGILEKDLEYWTAQERIAELVRGRYAQMKGDIDKLKAMYREEASCVVVLYNKVRGQLIMLAQLRKLLGGGASAATPSREKKTPFPAEARLSSVWVEARDGRAWKVIKQNKSGVIPIDAPRDLKICAKLEKGAPLLAYCYINNRDPKNPNARKEVAKNGIVKFAFTRAENGQLGEGRYEVSILAAGGSDPSFRPYAVNVVIQVGNAPAPGTVSGGGDGRAAAGSGAPASVSKPAKQRHSPEIVLAPIWVLAKEGDEWKRYDGNDIGNKTFVITLPGPAEIKICTQVLSGKPQEAHCGVKRFRREEIAKGELAIPDGTTNLVFGQVEMPPLARMEEGEYVVSIFARDQGFSGWAAVEIKVGKGEERVPLVSVGGSAAATPPGSPDEDAQRKKVSESLSVLMEQKRYYDITQWVEGILPVIRDEDAAPFRRLEEFFGPSNLSINKSRFRSVYEDGLKVLGNEAEYQRNRNNLEDASKLAHLTDIYAYYANALLGKRGIRLVVPIPSSAGAKKKGFFTRLFGG